MRNNTINQETTSSDWSIFTDKETFQSWGKIIYLILFF